MAARLIRMALWLGLLYGVVEGLAFWTLGFIPGVLSWRTGNSYHVLWFAPLFYGAVFLALGLGIALLSKTSKRVPWDVVMVFTFVFAGAYLMLRLPNVLWPLACLLLALGVATQATRLYRRFEPTIGRLITRTLPLLAGAVAVVAAVCLAFGPVRERVRLARLPKAGAGKPNVVLLVIDTQRADHLSSYGYARPTTPRIDSLAREGVLYENAYSQSSWTLPSHAGLFTGRPMHEHRAGMLRRPYLDGRFPTLAEVLRDNGYATGGFIANGFWVGRQTGLARGFTHFEDYYASAGDAAMRTVLGRMIAYDWVPRWRRIDIPGRKDAREVNDEMLRWIDRQGDRPFFAFANYLDVHTPRFPPKETAGMFGWNPAFDRVTGQIDIGQLTKEMHVPPADEIARRKAAYDEALVFVDRQIGRLVDELRRRGKLDNTMIIVTGDHGESWGEHGMLQHGHSVWRDQVHVPLVIRFPAKLAAGVRERRAVSNVWLPSMIAAFAGVPAPASFAAPSLLPGRPGDLAQADTLSRTAPSDSVLVEVSRRSTVGESWPSSRGWMAGIFADQWGYVLQEAGPAELYDVLADPAEANDLLHTPGGATVAAALRTALDARHVAALAGQHPAGTAAPTRGADRAGRDP